MAGVPDLIKQLGEWLSDPIVSRALNALFILILLLVISRILRSVVVRRIPDPVSRYRVRKLVVFVVFAVGLITLVAVFSERLRGFTVAIGVTGAGVAFALQEVIISLAGWLAITFGRYYKAGDRINLGGVVGDVIDIGMLRTTLMECGEWVQADLFNGRIVRVSNSFVFKQPVFNYSGDFAFLWDEISLPVKYGSDYHLAKRIIEQVGQDLVGPYSDRYEEAWTKISRKFLVETQSLDPVVTISANDQWIEFTLRYIVEYRNRRVTKDRIFWRILEEIDATNGAVGIAAATLNIEKLVVSDIPPVNIHLKPGPKSG
ncbi:MAG: mechanosensitive ion channel [Candidatus Aminicenantes bacterium]|nr:mechanosensitive ion channel [Candidatus Aminicenantes bacterium]